MEIISLQRNMYYKSFGVQEILSSYPVVIPTTLNVGLDVGVFFALVLPFNFGDRLLKGISAG